MYTHQMHKAPWGCRRAGEVQVVDPSKVYDGLEKRYHFAPIGPSRSATEVTPFQLQEAPGVKEQICADDDLKEIFMLGRKKCWLRSPNFSTKRVSCSVKKKSPWGCRMAWRSWLKSHLARNAMRANSMMTPMLREILWNALDIWWNLMTPQL